MIQEKPKETHGHAMNSLLCNVTFFSDEFFHVFNRIFQVLNTGKLANSMRIQD